MKVRVKPKKGLKVRKEDGTLLAEKGEKVTRNSYWVRRIKDGDAIDMTPKKKPVKADTEGESA